MFRKTVRSAVAIIQRHKGKDIFLISKSFNINFAKILQKRKNRGFAPVLYVISIQILNNIISMFSACVVS